MFKQWFLKTFFRNRILLENIETLYKFTNRVEIKKEVEKKEITEDKK